MDTLLPLTGCGLMIVSLGYVITFWFRTMSAFDKFVQYECENLPEQWERDGQPFGMFWKPKDKKVRAINRYFFSNPGITQLRLLFKTPDWIKEHPEAADHLKQIRRYTLFWNIGVIVWFAVVFPTIVFVFTPR